MERPGGTPPQQDHPALRRALAKTRAHLDSSPGLQLVPSPHVVVQRVHRLFPRVFHHKMALSGGMPIYIYIYTTGDWLAIY
ncbi:hypothetical protein GDO81_028608 [Engystomops pustulosus]|uniref:Uncharacterized protein n=1 Tax=Engystomops pustulosus TaxID=76066 RepID=A0AAV6YJN0_ENGPU|nr:hypothetical protein GDO81_028608 [Engystomops pustulosus]